MKNTLILLYILFTAVLAACSSHHPRSTATGVLKPTETAVIGASREPTSSSIPKTNKGTEAPVTRGPAHEILIDDFEKPTTAWKPGTLPGYQDSSAVSVSLSREHASQGQGTLALTFARNNKPKAIFVLEGQFDASAEKYLAFDLSDPQGSVAAVGIAVCTGSEWYWHESPPVVIQAGANSLVFDLTASTYKTAATSWELKAQIANLQDVKRWVVILYPKAGGAVYLDNFRLLPAETKVTLSPTVQPDTLTAIENDRNIPTSTPVSCPGKAVRNESTEPLSIYLSTPIAPVRYEPIEFDLQTSFNAQNPYDPAEIDLEINVTAPDGSQFSVPAFWFQDFDPARLMPCGQAGWKARLTPTQEGEWTIQAKLAGKNITSQPLDVKVASSSSHGFVRLHPQNPNYFAFDDGSTFFPVGLNIGWWQSSPLEDYARWMDRLSANGGTLIRVWMADWSFGIEWNDTGLGNYDNRQYQAWLLDQLFQMARQRGIYIELVLLNHGAFSETVNPEWTYNPYNAALGGPLKSPAEFAKDETARQFFKRRVRYIAARWGYSTQLFAWEWWNEVNWTPISTQDLADWLVDMTAYLKGFDPYRHLVSISYASSGPANVLSLPEIDFVQQHEYSQLDPMVDFPELLSWEHELAPGKPVLFAEFGYSAGGESAKSIDKQGIHFHNGLWAATFSGFASPAMYWWWDSYIDPLSLWGQFGRLTSFLQGEDLALLRSIGSGKIWLTDDRAKVLALSNDEHLLAWVRNANYEAAMAAQASYFDIHNHKTPEAEWRYQLPALSGLTLNFKGLKDGTYTVKWYDPSTGQWLLESTGDVRDGSLLLSVPDFSIDLALKLELIK